MSAATAEARLDDGPRLGSRYPRISTSPLRPLTRETSLGFDVAEFAEHVLNLPLLPWQEEFLVRALELVDELNAFGQVVGRNLRYRTILLLVGRQNGKSTVMIVLALYFMLVYARGELVLSTAQNLETSEGTWELGLNIMKEVPALAALIPSQRGEVRKNGQTALNLENGSTWKVATANRKGGRSKSARLVMLDELREHLNTEAWAAISNTTLAKADAIVLGVSNAGDVRSVVLKDQRAKAIKRLNDPATATGLFEWSAPGENDPTGVPAMDPDDREGWLMANPACGHPHTGMTLDTLAAARESATDTDWKTENLCQWVVVMDAGPWSPGVWESGEDVRSKLAPDSPVWLSVETSLDRTMSYVAAAGWSSIDPGRVHVEIISAGPGNLWVPRWVDARFDRIGPAGILVQGPKGSPSADLGQALEDLGLPVNWVQGSDVTGSAMSLFDGVKAGLVVHLGQPVLDMAAKTAQLRYAGDGVFMFDRRKSPIDVAPLIAVAEAYYFLVNNPGAGRRSAYEAEDGGFVSV